MSLLSLPLSQRFHVFSVSTTQSLHSSISLICVLDLMVAKAWHKARFAHAERALPGITWCLVTPKCHTFGRCNHQVFGLETVSPPSHLLEDFDILHMLLDVPRRTAMKSKS